MDKRGISPLIATVLIIGFTVALAAVIMTWGQSFSRGIQEQTEETSTQQITCAQDVMFDIKNVCETTTDGTYKITIANNGNKKIDSFRVRYYESADDVIPQDVTFGGDGIDSFGIESDNTVASGQSDVVKIEVMPVITIESKQVTCSSTLDTYGDIDGSIIAPCS